MKRTSWGGWSFFGEGISFLMGCSKNYIMYWGGLHLLIYLISLKKCQQTFINFKIKIVHILFLSSVNCGKNIENQKEYGSSLYVLPWVFWGRLFCKIRFIVVKYKKQLV